MIDMCILIISNLHCIKTLLNYVKTSYTIECFIYIELSKTQTIPIKSHSKWNTVRHIKINYNIQTASSNIYSCIITVKMYNNVLYVRMSNR